MAKDKGKYPWFKSIFGKKPRNPVEGVYAGPAQMNPNPRPGMGKVYAGPKPPEKEPEKADDPEDVNAIEDVYAGPEYFGVTDEPEDAPVECVYAGPEMWEDQPVLPEGSRAEAPRCPSCNEPVPENTRFCPNCGAPLKDPDPETPERPAMNLVYASPEYFKKRNGDA